MRASREILADLALAEGMDAGGQLLGIGMIVVGIVLAFYSLPRVFL